MKPDQERVRTLLTETITLLCKNGLHFKKQLRVQGLLGVTLDDDEVFIVHLNETLEEKSVACRASEESVQNANEVSASQERALSNGSPNRRLRKRRQFQSRSAVSAEEVESEASPTVEEAFPRSRLEISQLDSTAEVAKHAPDSCHSYDATSPVPVKQEPNDDDLIVVEKAVPPKRHRLCGKSPNLIESPKQHTSDDTTRERNSISNRTHLSDPACTSELRSQKSSVSTKTELPDDDPEFDVSGPSKFGMPNETPVQQLYNVAMSENLWPESQCLSDTAGSVQRFSAGNITDVSWTSVPQQNRADCFPAPTVSIENSRKAIAASGGIEL